MSGARWSVRQGTIEIRKVGACFANDKLQGRLPWPDFERENTMNAALKSIAILSALSIPVAVAAHQEGEAGTGSA